MVAIQSPSIALEKFLVSPKIDTLPAWEYINGAAYQKNMPKIRHSLLQKLLLCQMDQYSEDYTALPELRYTFGGRSLLCKIRINAAWSHRLNLVHTLVW